MIVTVDELRALQRIAVLSLPAFVTSGDTGELAVDAAALRGLAARELISFTGDDVRVGSLLRRALGGCSAPLLLTEIERERAGQVERFAVAAGAEPPVSLLTDLGAGLLSVEVLDTPPETLVERLVRLNELVEAGDCRAFTVDAQAQAEADARTLQGDRDEAVGCLVRSGVATADAQGWVTAVAGRRMSVVLSAAQWLNGRFEGGELRWLVADDGTAWRVDPTEEIDPSEEIGGPTETRALITPGATASLRRDMRNLIERKVQTGR